MTPESADREDPRALEARARFLHPGEWAVSAARPLATLLGSCVAVCLWDKRLLLGGMNHFMLPMRQQGRLASEDQALAGDFAMELLYNALLKEGAQPKRLVAKVFGGARVIETLSEDIGRRNVDFACTWLERQRIPIAARDVLGVAARRVVFSPLSGSVFVRHIRSDAAALASELAYLKALSTARPSEVELF